MSDLLKLMAEFRAGLLRREAAAQKQLLESYNESWRAIETEIARLVALSQEDDAARSITFEIDRLRALEAQVMEAVRELGLQAAEITESEQREFATRATMHAKRMADVAAASSRGSSASVAGSFQTLARGAIESFVGASGDGSPLRDSFDGIAKGLGLETGERVRRAMIQGLTLGMNPRDVARMVRREADAKGTNPQRNPAIIRRLNTAARTEIFRAYRESTRATYQANSRVVKGWRHAAKRDSSTCIVCWARHGKVFPLNVPMATHPNCRCVMLPVTDENAKFETGEERFNKLERGVQKDILGDKAFEAWEQREITSLDEFVGERQSEKWGVTLYRRSLKEIQINRESIREVGEREMLGLRAPAYNRITREQRRFIQQEFLAIGGNNLRQLKFNKGAFTGYRDSDGSILVRGNVYPMEGSAHPRSRMSVRAALAHELGHHNYQGTTLEENSPQDEFRASYWAAVNVPNLSAEERADLMYEALLQAEAMNRKIKPTWLMRKILRGEYEYGNRQR